MPAGSAFGPMTTKSLYITSKRFTPKPSATNFSSCGLACTNTTSASPRLAVSSAWPVPCATTFTSMPVLALNSGRMWPNGVLRRRGGGDDNGLTLLRAGGCGGDERDGGRQNDQATAGRHDVLLLVRVSRHRRRSNQELAGGKSARLLGLGRGQEGVGRTALDHAAAMHQHDLAGEPLGLAEIVGRHHHLDAACDDLADHVLDRLGRGRIEARGRLIEQENLRLDRKSTRLNSSHLGISYAVF